MKILEMICTIPENIGWMLAGAATMLCVVMVVTLGRTLIDMYKCYHDDDDGEV